MQVWRLFRAQNFRRIFHWKTEPIESQVILRHPVAILESRLPTVRRYSSSLPLPSLNTLKPHSIRIIPIYQISPATSRLYSTNNNLRWQSANNRTVSYMIAIAVTVVGLSYAAVPLYRVFCQASGYGGTVTKTDPSEKIEKMVPVEERELTIRFNANRSAGMRWSFRPQQKEIKLVPGETALAFYTAINPSDEPITGIATYNVIPFEAGQYFNKIQCFCFEEQRLNPNEEVDMPVFFYIDPEFTEDPAMAKVETITLSYTFFEAKDSNLIDIPMPTTLKQ